jgi:hypothetical protein
MDWKRWSSYSESNHYFCLITGEGTVSIIPKKALADTKQQDVFRELLELKLGSRKVVMSFRPKS